MDGNDETNPKYEAWTIIVAVGVVAVVLGALLIFFLMSA
jgi:hypothetical protein